MITIGIDPSINSTGICVSHNDKNYYYIIPSKMTKKMDQFQHEYICLLPYTKYSTKEGEYTDKEKFKTTNIYSICYRIKRVIEQVIEATGEDSSHIIVNMEGVSYGSVGSAALVDLAGLNFAIRMTLLQMHISFNIISPTSLKKFAVANGGAEKDVMIDSWKRLDQNIKDVNDIKIDDLADSYFLAQYKN